jgi:hypothetical protein
MRPLQPNALYKRRFMWLLWLALLTPIAQTVATWHALSHVQLEATGEGGGKQALHPTLCDLCLAAAALTNGAPAAKPPSLPHLIALREAPRANFSRVWFALTARAYESRAPPFLLH